MPAGAFGAVRPVGAIPPTRYRVWPKPSIFDPLGNRNSALRVNYQKVILL